MVQKKVVICGSVDDGKSTLIGRLLFDSNNIFKDESLNLKKISKRYGTQGNQSDLALLLDGLKDEREQGITIDVAHRYINYKNQRIVLHDSPGHDQYTRNVLTAASNCSIAIVLLDCKKGVLTQTKRHLKILDFVGVKNVFFAINKIDLFKYKPKTFLEIKSKLEKFTKKLNFKKIIYIPVSALKGDNIVYKSKKIKWFKGKSILEEIYKTKEKINTTRENFLPIQHVHRPDEKTRLYLGNISGNFSINLKNYYSSTGSEIKIKKIYSDFKSIDSIKDSAVAIDLDQNIDLVRGDVIYSKSENIKNGNFFRAEIVATSSEQIIPGREYLIRIHNKLSKITILKVKAVFDFNTDNYGNGNVINTNDLGIVEFSSNDMICYSEFKNIPKLGSFILIDTLNFNVVAAGKIEFALRRSSNIFQTKGRINQSDRERLKNQKAACIWITGLSGSGKSTLAQNLEKKLISMGKHVYVLDGDNLRSGINKNLGFSDEDRVENIRRIAEISKLMVDAGLIVLVSVISPFERERNFAKSLFQKDEFFEIYLNTPLDVCLKRDPKKLYKKVKKNKKFNNTGLTGAYEEPKDPFLTIDTSKISEDESVEKILNNVFI